MKQTHPISLCVYSVVAALLFSAQLSVAKAEPAQATSELQSDYSSIMSMSVASDDNASLKVEINPTSENAVSCTCASAGAGCSGACPNAPGKRRQCRNVAPKGKPKICSCTTDY